MDKAFEVFKEVWQVELFRGVLLTLGVLFGLVLLSWIFKIFIFCKFGRRRCSVLNITCPNGTLTVAAKAISSAIEAELKTFPELEIRRIQLYCKRGVYSMDIHAALLRTASLRGLPELYSLIEPLVKRRLEEIFGVKDMGSISLRIERAGKFDDEPQDSPELPDMNEK